MGKMKAPVSAKEFLIILALSFVLFGFAASPKPRGVVFYLLTPFLISLAASAVLSASRTGSIKKLFPAFLREIRLTAREAVSAARHLKAKACAPGTAAFILFITAAGAAARAYFLSQPMRYDEAFTFMYFVREPGSLLFYRSPNNHVLHTLLVKISVSVFGGSEAAIRLPAFIAGVLAVPAVFYLSRIITGSPKAGYLSAGAMAVFPYIILFDTNARGYSLLVLLSLLLAALCVRYAETPSRRMSVIIAFAIAPGTLAVPSFLFSAAGILLWLACLLYLKEKSFLRVFGHYASGIIPAAAVLVFAVYLPVVVHNRGFYNITRHFTAHRAPFAEFAAALPGHFRDTLTVFSRDVPAPFIIFAAVLTVFGAVMQVRNRRPESALLLPALAAGGAAVLFACRAVPFARTWIYFIPFAAVSADAGFSFLPGPGRRTPAVFSVLFASVLAFFAVSRGAVSRYPDTGHFPEAPAISKIIAENMEEGDAVAARSPADAPVEYYLWRLGVPFAGTPAAGTGDGRVFFVVKPSAYSLSCISGEGAEKLAECNDAALYVGGR